MKMTLKFCVAGGIGFLCDAGFLAVLTHGLGYGPILSRVVSFSFAVLVAWWINRRWAFRDGRQEKWLREFSLYLSTQGLWLGINFAVYAGLVLWAGTPFSLPLMALTIAAALALTINFWRMSTLVLRKNDGDAPLSMNLSAIRGWYPLLLLLAICLLAGGATSVALGQDANFDWKNYHLYNAWAFLGDRRSVDFFAAGIQGYFNPLLDVPYYLLSCSWLPMYPKVVAFIMGFPYGMVVFLTLMISWEIFSQFKNVGRMKILLCVVSTLFGATGVATISQTGTVFNELQTASLVLAGVWMLLYGLRWKDDGMPRRYLLAAGVLLGLAAGLKLTACVFAPAVVLAFCLVSRSWHQAMMKIVIFSIAWWGAFLVIYGWWGWVLYRETGNPTFPMFNGIFHSSWIGSGSGMDLRFMPRTVIMAIFYPFYWIKKNDFVMEPVFADPRFALAMVSCGLIALWAISTKVRAVMTGSQGESGLRHSAPVVFLFAFVAISYGVWEKVTSILRYAVPMEALSGVILVFVFVFFWEKALGRKQVRAVIATLFVAALFLCLFKTHYPAWGRVRYGHSVLSCNRVDLERNSLVVLHGQQSSYIAPCIQNHNPDVRFVGITKDALGGKGYLLWDNLSNRIKKHPGPVYVLIRNEYEGQKSWLEELGFFIDYDSRQTVLTNLDRVGLYRIFPDGTILGGRPRNALFGSGRSDIFASGWSADEGAHRWSEGHASALKFILEKTDPLPAKLSLLGDPLGEQKAEIRLNGQLLYSGMMPAGGLQNLDIPPGALNIGSNTMTFAWPMARRPGNGDPRTLAFAFKHLEFK
jgi:putative flippase GtrA